MSQNIDKKNQGLSSQGQDINKPGADISGTSAGNLGKDSTSHKSGLVNKDQDNKVADILQGHPNEKASGGVQKDNISDYF